LLFQQGFTSSQIIGKILKVYSGRKIKIIHSVYKIGCCSLTKCV
jgi:hypothetical protein